MARVHPSEAPPTGAHVQQQHAQPAVHSANQTAEFFLANYRLGKTLGIGSFGKVRAFAGTPMWFYQCSPCNANRIGLMQLHVRHYAVLLHFIDHRGIDHRGATLHMFDWLGTAPAFLPLGPLHPPMYLQNVHISTHLSGLVVGVRSPDLSGTSSSYLTFGGVTCILHDQTPIVVDSTDSMSPIELAAVVTGAAVVAAAVAAATPGRRAGCVPLIGVVWTLFQLS